MRIWLYTYNETEKKVELIETSTNEKYCESNLVQDGYFDSIIYATMGVSTTNKALKEGTLFVQKCKDCGMYYFMTADEKWWFKDRGLSVPKRCHKCRKNRKGRVAL